MEDLEEQIDNLGRSKKIFLMGTITEIGLAGYAYAYDSKALFYSSCFCGLYLCYRGIKDNNQRNELIRKQMVEEKFGGKK